MVPVVQKSILRCPRFSATFLSSVTARSRPRYKGELPGLFSPTIIIRSMGSGINSEAVVAGSSRPLYAYIEDVESLERYCAGGYHPVRIGDRLHNRYQIIHKLGFGTYSTAWLSLDEMTKTHVALKIGLGNAKSPSENEILHLLQDTDASLDPHPGRTAIPSIIDEFGFEGPNGHHRCLVTDLARASIAETREASSKRVFQPAVARAISAQLIQAVAFLHARGVVHSGKIFSQGSPQTSSANAYPRST